MAIWDVFLCILIYVAERTPQIQRKTVRPVVLDGSGIIVGCLLAVARQALSALRQAFRLKYTAAAFSTPAPAEHQHSLRTIRRPHGISINTSIWCPSGRLSSNRSLTFSRIGFCKLETSSRIQPARKTAAVQGRVIPIPALG